MASNEEDTSPQSDEVSQPVCPPQTRLAVAPTVAIPSRSPAISPSTTTVTSPVTSPDPVQSAGFGAFAAASQTAPAPAATPSSSANVSNPPSGPPGMKRQSSKTRVSSAVGAASPVVGPAGSPSVRPSIVDSHVPLLASTSNSPTAVRLRRGGSNQSERKSSRVIVFSADDDEAELEADYERERHLHETADLPDAIKDLKVGRRLRSKASSSVSGPPGKRSSTGPSKLQLLSPSSAPSDASSLPPVSDTQLLQTPQSSSSKSQKQKQKQARPSVASASSHPEPIPELDDEEAEIGTDSLVPVSSHVSTASRSSSHQTDSAGIVRSGSSSHHRTRFGTLLHEIGESKDRHDVRTMQKLEEDLVENLEEQDEEDDEEDEEDEEEEEEDDNADAASISSTETFTLRERQDAINITHPFGIRIWKPAVYKKTRSVQRFAEGEIHSGPDKDVSWLIWLGNIIWSLTFGILLLVICWTGALLFRVLFFWSRSSTMYSRTLFFIGKYLVFPFGICVQLNQDKDYLQEDEGEGRTFSEYQEWQVVDSSRLFFGPSSAHPESSHHEETSRPEASGQGTSSSNGNLSDSTGETTIDGQQQPKDQQQALPRSRSGSSGESSVNTPEFQRKLRFFGRGDWNLGRILFFIWFYTLLYPVLILISGFCWLCVFSIPMGKVTMSLGYHLRRHPLALAFRPASLLKSLSATEYESSILLCTYRALGSRYYKYTVDGTNIFFINLMALVGFVIVDYYTFESLGFTGIVTSPTFIFGTSMLSIVPLAYFIGQAVASISAQSSMGMGATINAFFSTVVEVFLYCVALSRGKGDLVEGSIVGSIFGGILLLPGLSMCAGAIKRKTQRYNPKSAGVSSTMLLFAIIGAFAPTIFYQIYGTYELRCQDCEVDYVTALNLAAVEDCQRCHFYQAPITSDSLYADIIKPFSSICAALLFIAYVIGLWFTLRTHAAMIWQTPTSSELHSQVLPHGAAPQSILPLTNDPSSGVSTGVHTAGSVSARAARTGSKSGPVSGHAEANRTVVVVPPQVEDVSAGQHAEGGGHDAPNWSRTKSTVILLGATILYAVIAEILVGTVDGVLSSVDISEKFVGVTIFALVPNTTEFLNAISFAMNGNIALSMEIGSAYVLQVCLLQIPALVLYSIMSEPLFPELTDFMFTLIFPRWDLFMVIFCVFVFSYIYAEGKSNYFKGSILVLSYLVVMVGFYYTGRTAEAGISQLSSTFRLITNGGAKIIPS